MDGGWRDARTQTFRDEEGKEGGSQWGLLELGIYPQI